MYRVGVDLGWAIEGSIVMGVSAFLVYLYFFRKGQFSSSEESKYIVFRDEDDA